MKLDRQMNTENKATQGLIFNALRKLIKQGNEFVFSRKLAALLLMQIMLFSIVAPGLAFAETGNATQSVANLNPPANPLTGMISASSAAFEKLSGFFTGFALISSSVKGKKTSSRKAMPVTSPTPPAKIMPGTVIDPPEGFNDPNGSLRQQQPSPTPTVEPSPTPTPSIYNDASWNSLFTSQNNLGSPTGQADSGFVSRGVAGKTREQVGNGNFSFDVPILSIPGRGNNASIIMTYNSQLWTKISGSASPIYTYNIDRNWVAPGFNLSFGYLDTYGAEYSVTTPNGTRHLLSFKEVTSDGQWNKYESSDGDFIQISTAVGATLGGEDNVWLQYPDGTSISYGATDESGRRYPTDIVDRNGNIVSVTYLSGSHKGRINKIIDTLNREIIFHYDDNPDVGAKSLVAISAPGLADGPRREVVRFYYENIQFQPQNRFDGAVTLFGESTVPNILKVLRYVYFPGTKEGYKYDYSTHFGMIYKITQFAGMQAGSTVVTNEGQWLNWTKYNYPGIESPVPALTDIPKYNKRTDEWQGRNSATPYVHTYQTTENATTHERVSRIFMPDGNISQSKSYYKPSEIINGTWHNYWEDGLMFETALLDPNENVLQKQILTWQQGPDINGFRNPQVEKVESINEAGESGLTAYSYDNFNNPIVVAEYGFPNALGVRPELRKTVTTYETHTGYMAVRLIRLPKEVKRIVNGVTVSKVKYEYDDIENVAANPGAPPPHVTQRVGVTQHRWEYNPFMNHNITVCGPQGCVTVIVYYPQKVFKGNVTKEISYADASIPEPGVDPKAIETDYEYDMLGNALKAGRLGCCNEKVWEYVGANQFAYPISETKNTDDPITGTNTPIVNESTYDFNTGLLIETKDENEQKTQYQYEADTLRQTKTIYPNSGYIETEYSDKLVSDPAQAVPIFVRTTAKLDAVRTVQNYTYFDGRGAKLRSAVQTPDNWNISATEYDTLGRPFKSYNPFYGSAPNVAIPSGVKWTEVLTRDLLDRATEVKLQDGTSVKSTFNGTVTTVEDQAGKKRRQIFDALGRVWRVDEPDADGDLGSTTSPKQSTFYEYDGNDNVTKTTQTGNGTTQTREFKYDSLSRLTHEKQVEATATLSEAGEKMTSGGQWTKVLKYDNLGLLREAVDARGVKTVFEIYDGLHRIRKINFSDGTPGITYTYDQARNDVSGHPYFNKGRVTRLETAAGDPVSRPDTPATATEFDYNKMGELVSHRQSIGTQTYNLSYGYNLAGQLTSETYPSGKVITTQYDAGGRLSSISDANRIYANGFQYQGKAGTLNSYALGNGTTETLTLNDRLQLESQSLKKGTEILQRYDYYFGKINVDTGTIGVNSNNGQLARIDSYIGANKQWEQRFAYDSVGRLSEARELQGNGGALSYKQKFDYDRFGNLYRKSQSNPVTGQQTPIGYTTIEDSDINKSTNHLAAPNVVYDDAGNVIQDGKFRNLKYYYDAGGRMYKTSNLDDTNQANSVYNASGQRVATKTNGVWTYRIYDLDDQLVAEYGQSFDATGGVKYLYQDLQGSTRLITNQNGVIQARFDYQTFGQEIGTAIGQRTTAQGYNANNNLNQKYALTERDSATGLDHTWFRKLEQNAGRWTTPDPYNGSMSVDNPQSLNRYSYVLNQPTNFIDPTGLLTPGEACSYSGKRGSDGQLIYDGTVDANGNCKKDSETPVYIYWSGGWGGLGSGGFNNPFTSPSPCYAIGGSGGDSPKPPSKPGFLRCVAKCMNDARFDKVLGAIGDSTGIPYAGTILQSLSWVGTGAAIANQALNATSLGKKPRGGLATNRYKAGDPTSWQHTVSGKIGRKVGAPVVGRVGRFLGRVSIPASIGILVAEGAYTTGTGYSCAAICGAPGR